MPYVRDMPPVGATQAELVRFYAGEFLKIEGELLRLDGALESINIVGAAANWFWDDVFPGEPASGFMRADSNTLGAITQINVNFENAQGKSIVQLLKTSTIEVGDLVGLINTSGLGSGNYDVAAPVAFFPNHIEITVQNFQGQSGNPAPNDILQMRWEFNTFPPQPALP